MTYDPWSALGALPDIGLGVVELPIGSGWWMPEQRVILIERRQTQAERRAACAHELEHALAGDLCSSDAAERGARLRAARKLIPLEDLARALCWSQDEHEVADELWVDVPTVRVRIDNLTDDEKAYLDQRVWPCEESVA